MRRVHRARRRRRGARRASCSRCRPTAPRSRRSKASARTDGELSPVQAGVPRLPRPAVRVLHARVRRLGDRVPARQPRPDRRRDPRGAVGQPLPLHRLPGHRRARCARPPTPTRTETHDDRRRRRPARLGTSGRASTASKTRGCSPGDGTYVDDISLPGMLHACFVRSPFARAAIRGIDTVGRARAARRPLRVHRRRPEPGRQGAVAHVDRPGQPRDAAPAARRGRGALRRRSGRARRRRQPVRSPRTRPSSSRSTTSRCRPSSTTRPPSTPTRSSTKATAPTSSARSTACPRRRSTTCSRRRRTS